MSLQHQKLHQTSENPMKKYVRCIHKGIASWLTNGKVYEVVDTWGTDGFRVMSDVGMVIGYDKYHFQVVGCPCGISACVKHRKQS
jgi:hypothetical protein